MRSKNSDGNNTINMGAKKVGAAVLIQVLILGLSFITGFIMPKYMGPEKYGYWQLYIFYISYLNLFGLGFNDGFALFYGGYKFEDLPFKRIRSSMRVFYGYLIVVTIVLFAFTTLIQDDAKKQIFIMLAVNLPLVCLQYFVLTAFLSVNKTSIYNGLNLLTKVLATAFFTGLLLINITSVNYMMGAETIARAIVSIICLFLGNKFLFGGDADLRIGRHEFCEKTKYGVNIMLGIIASSFIPVAGRVIIEHTHSIAEYGLYSFATTLLMIIIVFTSTAGVVLFPVLKTLPEKQLPFYYSRLSYIFSNLIYVAFLVYIPFVFLIKHFMQDYVSVLSYMYILLAMCLPLGKVNLLLIPYYKTFRLERSFLVYNISGAAAMIALTLATQLMFDSIIAIATVTTIVLTIWYILAESHLIKKMRVSGNWQDLLQNAGLMVAFVLSASFNNMWLFFAVYGLTLIIFILSTHKKLLSTVKALQKG